MPKTPKKKLASSERKTRAKTRKDAEDEALLAAEKAKQDAQDLLDYQNSGFVKRVRVIDDIFRRMQLGQLVDKHGQALPALPFDIICFFFKPLVYEFNKTLNLEGKLCSIMPFPNLALYSKPPPPPPAPPSADWM